MPYPDALAGWILLTATCHGGRAQLLLLLLLALFLQLLEGDQGRRLLGGATAYISTQGPNLVLSQLQNPSKLATPRSTSLNTLAAKSPTRRIMTEAKEHGGARLRGIQPGQRQCCCTPYSVRNDPFRLGCEPLTKVISMPILRAHSNHPPSRCTTTATRDG